MAYVPGVQIAGDPWAPTLLNTPVGSVPQRVAPQWVAKASRSGESSKPSGMVPDVAYR